MARRVTKNCEILEEIELEDYVDDVDKIIFLQAVWRGYLVRKWVLESKSCFESIAQEIEQKSNVLVEWKYPYLCVPAVRKKRREKLPLSEKKVLDSDRSKKDIENKSESDFLTLQPGHIRLVAERDGIAHDKITMPTTNSYERSDVQEVSVYDSHTVLNDNSQSDSKSVNKQDKIKPVTNSFPSTDSRSKNTISNVEEKTSIFSSTCTQTESDFEKNIGSISCEETPGGKVEKVYTKGETTQDLKEETKSTAVQTTEETLLREEDDLPETTANIKSPVNTAKKRHLTERKKSSVEDESYLPLGDSTTFWDDSSVSPTRHDNEHDISNCRDPVRLRDMRHHTAMELLWVQQAIQSRKNYLRLKEQMKTSTKG